jgi:hypothetical protein
MGRRLMLVEGNDDEHVVRHLCRAHQIEIDIEQPRDDGIAQLIDQVPARLTEADLQRLAVVIDADEDVQSRWEQLRDRLRRRGYDKVPDTPDKDGTIVDLHSDFGDVRLGVWITPDNRLPGMLENFVAFLVPKNDKMMPHVDRFLDSIPRDDRLFSPVHLPKAKIHSYLAIQNQPGKPLGLAITARYFDAGREVVRPFLKWINDVLIADGQQP